MHTPLWPVDFSIVIPDCLQVHIQSGMQSGTATPKRLLISDSVSALICSTLESLLSHTLVIPEHFGRELFLLECKLKKFLNL